MLDQSVAFESGYAQSILVVDDDPVTRALLYATLNTQNYQVLEASSGNEAQQKVQSNTIDLILLDRRLPDCDGLMLLRKLRENTYQVPVVVLSILGDEHDRVLGLELGAVDYLAKPFNTDELIIRVRNALQHSKHATKRSAIHTRFGDYVFHSNSRTLKKHDNKWHLTFAETKLLSLLLNNRGYTISRDRLTQGMFNRDWTPGDRTVDVLIGRLRKLIEANPKKPEWIVTMHGEGYCFTDDSSEESYPTVNQDMSV